MALLFLSIVVLLLLSIFLTFKVFVFQSIYLAKYLFFKVVFFKVFVFFKELFSMCLFFKVFAKTLDTSEQMCFCCFVLGANKAGLLKLHLFSHFVGLVQRIRIRCRMCNFCLNLSSYSIQIQQIIFYFIFKPNITN